MQYSFKRKSEFQQFQAFVNLKPHKMLQPCQTRWLSLGAAIDRVLEQYEPLKLYFGIESFDGVSGADEIQISLNNPVTKLYLEFLQFVLPIFSNMNTEFQSEAPKIHLLYSKMSFSFKLLLSFYLKSDYLKITDLKNLQFKNPDNYVQLDKLYLGPKVAVAIADNKLDQSTLHSFRLNCLNVYIEAASQIYKRFHFQSEEIQILKELEFLNPKNIRKIESIGFLATKLLRNFTDINSLDREFRQLKTSDTDFEMQDIQFWQCCHH